MLILFQPDVCRRPDPTLPDQPSLAPPQLMVFVSAILASWDKVLEHCETVWTHTGLSLCRESSKRVWELYVSAVIKQQNSVSPIMDPANKEKDWNGQERSCISFPQYYLSRDGSKPARGFQTLHIVCLKHKPLHCRESIHLQSVSEQTLKDVPFNCAGASHYALRNKGAWGEPLNQTDRCLCVWGGGKWPGLSECLLGKYTGRTGGKWCWLGISGRGISWSIHLLPPD